MAKFRNGETLVDAVQVVAADWNGRDFDGCPFSEVTQWIEDAYRTGLIRPEAPGCTDYAEWRMDTPDQGRVWVGPGDWFIRTPEASLTFCRYEDFWSEYEEVQ